MGSIRYCTDNEGVACLTIGLFDSGVGGLSVLRRVRDLQISEDCLYFADTLHMPYGSRSSAELREIVFAICDFLVAEGCRLIVMACNTSSALVLPLARARYKVPLIGVLEPGARAAAEVSRTGAIGVWATLATTRSQAYEKSILAYRPEARVSTQACGELAPLVEQGELCGPIVEQALAACLLPLLDQVVDTLVLGCTHYPFLLETLTPLLPPGVTVVDPAYQAAAAVASHSTEIHRGQGHTTCLVSGSGDNFLRVARGLWPDIGETKEVRFARGSDGLRVEMS
ncbi:MAG: Glutamate racemase [Firmicutes bacterium]|nr:Glutamate racemase [Bacillota bacterium]